MGSHPDTFFRRDGGARTLIFLLLIAILLCFLPYSNIGAAARGMDLEGTATAKYSHAPILTKFSNSTNSG